MRRASRLAAVLALAAALPWLHGCASLEPLLADLSGRPAPVLSGEAQQMHPTAPSAPERAGAEAYLLEVTAPEPLRTVLAKHLDLARFRDAPEAADMARIELDRLIAAAPAQARSIAETEGFFDAEVQVSRDRAEPPRVRVVVVPGPSTNCSTRCST